MDDPHEPDGADSRPGAVQLFSARLEQARLRASRAFVRLVPCQWVVLVILAGFLPPSSALAPGVPLGGLALVSVAVAAAASLLRVRPVAAVTRHAVAAAQAVLGLGLAVVLVGRVDVPVCVLGTLVPLVLLRDWRPLVTGAAVTNLGLIALTTQWPGAIGRGGPGGESWLGSVAWVAFGTALLAFATVQDLRATLAIAGREAERDSTNGAVERAVRARTAQLAASEQRFRTLVEQASDAFFVYDLTGRVVDVNHAACECLDCSRDDLVGLPITNLDVGLEVATLRAVLAPVAAGEAPTRYSHLRRKDGALFPVEVRSRAIETDDGRFIMSIVRDISERSRAESMLRASEARYRVLFESNPHPMWVFESTNYRFLEVNDAAVAHYGYTREQFLTMTIAELERVPDGPTPDPAEVAPAPGRPQLRVHRRADGEARQMELAAHPIEIDSLFAVMVLALDVTERRLLEEQLKQAQKLESIGQLAAGIAHEINTPIQYIGDNTTFIGDAFREVCGVLTAYRSAGGDPDALRTADEAAGRADLDYVLEEAPRALDQTLDGVGQVARIVKAMKEFAHPGSAEKTVVDLNRALETVITVARNEWKYVSDLRTDLDPTLPPIRGLPGELNQVFLNLLVNAAHAVRSAGEGRRGEIVISTRNLGTTVEVRVADNGCGIPRHIRGRVFDPFFTTKPVGQGTGQGLALAHAVVVNKHGGAITFESEAGEGTTFIVLLSVDGSGLSPSERVPTSATTRVPPNDGRESWA